MAFIGRVKDGEFAPKGTAFFVHYPCGPDGQWQYLHVVTARHVVERCRQLSEDATPHIRMNFRDGTSQILRINNDSWAFHDDTRVDVAVAAVLHPDGMDHTMVRSESFATQDVIEKHQIGHGNELFFPGLFVRHQGDKTMVPVVRRGSIAAMPQERVHTKFGNIEAYLVEARSIGGFSGSPVFVNLGPLNTGAGADVWANFGRTEPAEIAHLRFGPTYLLGMVHGHFGVRDILDISEDDGLRENESRSVNMGIGIVVPSIQILDVLANDSMLIAIREEAARKKIQHEESLGTEQD